MIDQYGESGSHEEGREPWDDAEHAAPEDHAAAFGTAPRHPHADDHLDHGRLALGEDERLPWLDSADDVDHEPRESGRFVGLIAVGSIALFGLIGAIYWATHNQSPSAQADGSLIEASKAPYKVEPANPGGRTFQGTGDASYKVSEGQRPDGSTAAAAASANGAETKSPEAAKAGGDKAAAEKAAGAKVADAKPAESKPAASAGAQGGVGVQVGAFSSHATAEAAWGKLSRQYSAL